MNRELDPEIQNHNLRMLTSSRRFEHPEITDERVIGIEGLLEQSQHTLIGREFTGRRLKLLLLKARRGEEGRRIANQMQEVIEPNIFTPPGAQTVESLIYQRVSRATIRLASRGRHISPVESNRIGIDLEGLTEDQFLENLRNWPNQYYARFEAPIL